MCSVFSVLGSGSKKQYELAEKFLLFESGASLITCVLSKMVRSVCLHMLGEMYYYLFEQFHLKASSDRTVSVRQRRRRLRIHGTVFADYSKGSQKSVSGFFHECCKADW